MKVALLAVLGLALGALGGAALGIGAGLTWIGMARTSGLDSGTLVFFTFMPLGAAIGGIGGALLFAVVAIRDAEIVIEGHTDNVGDEEVLTLFWTHDMFDPKAPDTYADPV